jgi:hypothetical protein
MVAAFAIFLRDLIVPFKLVPQVRVRSADANLGATVRDCHFVLGEFDCAYAEWSKGLRLVDEFRDPIQRDTVRRSWLEWKQEMEERQAAQTAAWVQA